MSKIDIQDVYRLAALKLEEGDEKSMLAEFDTILNAFSKISELDLKNVMPTVHPVPLELNLREDVVNNHFDSQSAVENAPETSGYLFKVPPVV